MVNNALLFGADENHDNILAFQALTEQYSMRKTLSEEKNSVHTDIFNQTPQPN